MRQKFYFVLILAAWKSLARLGTSKHTWGPTQESVHSLVTAVPRSLLQRVICKRISSLIRGSGHLFANFVIKSIQELDALKSTCACTRATAKTIFKCLTQKTLKKVITLLNLNHSQCLQKGKGKKTRIVLVLKKSLIQKMLKDNKLRPKCITIKLSHQVIKLNSYCSKNVSKLINASYSNLILR